MASPWDRLGQAASVLQLTGVDTIGLVSMIVQAAQIARRNRDQCQLLANQAKIMEDLLPELHIPELRRHPQTRRPLDQLNAALLHAFKLVRSCSEELKTTSPVYQFFTGFDMADKLRQTQEEIDRYITILPTITTMAILLGRGTYQEAQDATIDLIPAAQRPSLSLREVPGLLEFGELPPTGTIAGNVVSQPVVAERSGHSSFAFAQLEASTNYFAPTAEIGMGSLGKVYRGVLPDGSEVAIKHCRRLPWMNRENFRSRLDLFSRIRHRHLLGLMGYCSNQDGEWLFVYDYMKKGSLHDHLYTCHAPSPVVSSWKLRFRILLEASRGIQYLHSYAAPSVIHGNIKLSNIMLDGGWTARVSDFRHSLIEPEPELGQVRLEAGQLLVVEPDLEDDLLNVVDTSVNSDIRSFGIVMAQVLTGIIIIDERLPEIWRARDKRASLSNWEEERDERGSLSNWEEERAVDLVTRTAKLCIQDSGSLAMAEIVASLESAVALCEGGA